MAKTKNSARKYAAVALGLVGIAGLSLASAAQLTVNEDSPLVGVSTGAECDTAVNVDYTTTYAGGVFSAATVEVSDINVASPGGCVGRELIVYVLDVSGATLAEVKTTIDAASESINLPTGVNAAAVRNAAVAIN
ncbi:hypothetical protein [Demequina globuliformis]|uniref:hypothetical protein n=1 Tax=Demequina globuliformis TaxID=676202 RepID=UPI0007819124|nr:hypothetical protein [Demequina globuliformis]